MKVYVKGINSCVQRKQKVAQYIEYLKRNGHEVVDNYTHADKVLLWTCAFRKDVLENSICMINKLNEAGASVIVCGCLPDIDPERLSKIHHGEILPWKNDFNKISEIFSKETVSLLEMPNAYGESALCENIESYKQEHPNSNVQFYDMFHKIVINEGCSFECTYCSEKIMLPPYKSYPLDEILFECKRLISKANNYKIALFGESLGEYGNDIGITFPELLNKIKSIDSRISFLLFNMNPYHILKFYNDVEEMFAQNYFYHMNLPIQSNSNKVLSSMNRPYSSQDIEKVLSLLNKYNFSNFDTHIIIGFPGETEEDFLLTFNFIQKYKPNHVLLSKCMINKNIPASQLPDKINDKIIVERIKRIKDLCKQIGVFCNVESGKHMQERFKNRINRL